MFKECPKAVPYFGHSLTTRWATYAQRVVIEGPARVHRGTNAWSMSAQRMVMGEHLLRLNGNI